MIETSECRKKSKRLVLLKTNIDSHSHKHGRDSSVGRASDWRSGGPQFDPGSRHFSVILCLSFSFGNITSPSHLKCDTLLISYTDQLKHTSNHMNHPKQHKFNYCMTHHPLAYHCPWQRVRVVKEMDSKSIGLCPRGFESLRCRFLVPASLTSLSYTTRLHTATLKGFENHTWHHQDHLRPHGQLHHPSQAQVNNKETEFNCSHASQHQHSWESETKFHSAKILQMKITNSVHHQTLWPSG